MSVDIRTTTLSGENVYVSRLLPVMPSFDEQIRRRVRHELIRRCPAALRALVPGPGPEEGTHAYQTMDGLIVSQELFRTLQQQGLTAQVTVWTGQTTVTA